MCKGRGNGHSPLPAARIPGFTFPVEMTSRAMQSQEYLRRFGQEPGYGYDCTPLISLQKTT